MVQIEPKHPAETVREPAREQPAGEREQVVEHGHRLGNEPGDGPERQHDERPEAEAAPALAAHAVRAAEAADVDVLGGDVAVDDAGDDDGGDGDAVGDFARQGGGGAEGGGGGAEGGGGDVGAGVAVDDEGDDEVGACIDRLEEEEGFRVGFWGVEFGHEGEERDVAYGGGEWLH